MDKTNQTNTEDEIGGQMGIRSFRRTFDTHCIAKLHISWQKMCHDLSIEKSYVTRFKNLSVKTVGLIIIDLFSNK